MDDTPGSPVKVKVKAVLIDPRTMTVLWADESAAQTLTGTPDTRAADISLDQVVLMTGASGVPEALRAVADTGEPRHLSADLVSTGRGSMTVATSIYRLPDGMLLMLSEHTWQSGRATAARPHSGSRPARGR